MPDDPFTGLAHAAVSLHEMYVSLVQAGFTEEQAFDIIVRVIVEGLKAAE